MERDENKSKDNREKVIRFDVEIAIKVSADDAADLGSFSVYKSDSTSEVCTYSCERTLCMRCAELEGVDLKGAAHLTLTRLGGVIPQILDAAVEEKKDV